VHLRPLIRVNRKMTRPQMTKIKSYKTPYLQQLFLRSQMSSGQMLQVLKVPKRALRKPSLCLSSSLSFSKAQESLGLVFCCMVHQVLVRVSWPRHAQLNVTQHFSQFHHLIWCPNGRVSLKKWSNNFLS
jgi:hypothetical protein